MSLESKLANLTLGDESAVVAGINADGVEKSGFASSISGLAAKIASKEDSDVLPALATIKAVAEGASDAQPFVKDCLSASKSTWIKVFRYRLNSVANPLS